MRHHPSVRLFAFSLSFSTALLLSACTAIPDSLNPPSPTQEISAINLKAHVEVLASDKYEGRGAGYAGEAMAAEYIARRFKNIGLKPIPEDNNGWRGFLQPFDMHVLDGPVPWQILRSRNVAGALQGTDSDAGYIVIGAHYDGQGMTGQASLGRTISEGDEDYLVADGDVIWNSAVDNAVSIAALFEIARTLAEQQTPLRRTVLFVAFGAEESALDGSTYHVNNPVPGLGVIKAMINLEKLVGDPDADFLYVSYGSSSVFPLVTEIVVAAMGVEILPFYPGVIANTDHYAFILSRLPAITIGTGSVENVHTPSDNADGLDYALLEERTKFVAHYLSALADIEDPFEFSGDISGHYGASGGPATKAERVMRNFSGDNTFKVATVINGSPAGKAGLIAGDLIIAVNDAEVPKQTFYQGLEDILAEDMLCHELKLTIIRGDEILSRLIPAAC